MIFEMTLPDGEKIPYAQYAINDNQVINVLPVPPVVAAGVKCEGYDAAHWGSLKTLGFIMQRQCHNSLTIDNWDFETYPNPEIIILTALSEV
jgi:hypothetical protein